MTFPLFLAMHLIYGTFVGKVMFPRMRAEGEVLGPSLLLTLLPVAFVTAPIGAVFLRYSGGWFLHGVLVGEGNVFYERFHLGLLLATVILTGAATCAGIVNVAVWASRDKPRLAFSSVWLAIIVIAAVLGFAYDDVVTIRGTGGRVVWAHPTGVLSVVAAAALTAWVFVCRARFSAVPKLQAA